MTRSSALPALVLALAAACATSDRPAPPDCPEPQPAAHEPAPRDGFAVSTASEAGLPPARVKAFFDKARAERSTSLLVVVDGTLVAEDYFGGDPGPSVAMSVTKSVVALAVGKLLDDGHLELDRPLSETVLPEWAETDKAAITLRHLLTQTSGLTLDRYGVAKNDWRDGSIEAHGLASARESEPGETWAYNNNGIDFLSVVVHRANPEGLYLDDYLDATVFAALGTVGAHWYKDGHGQPRAAGELFMRPIDLAKIGQLVLDRGAWQGEQVVSPAYIDQMLAAVPQAKFYGFLWWRNGDRERVLAYRAEGYLGQHIVIVPDKRMVAVRTRDPVQVGDNPKEFGWYDFTWDVLALAGHVVDKADRNAFATVSP